jgi:single-strand DNA-binding protein
MSICQITVVGNLGRDPETREAGSSTVCSFSIAYNRKSKGEEFTDWYNVDAWGKLGELCQKYLQKGSAVVVSGTLAQRAYESNGEKRTSLDIRASDVHFLSRAEAAPAGEPASDDDDIGF